MTQLNALTLARSLSTIIYSNSIVAAGDQVLPGSCKAGQMCLVLNETSNSSILTIRSADNNNIETIRTGYCLLVAEIDNPQVVGDWTVVDLYEKGTWTPVVFFSTLGTASLVTNFAEFERFNNTVTIQFQGTITKGTASGTLQIRGLPYATQVNPNQPMAVSCSAITIPANSQLVAHFANNATVTEYVFDGAGTETAVTAAALAASATLRFAGSYKRLS